MSTADTADSRCNPRQLGVLVTRLFEAWEAGGVRFLVLRNYEQLPDKVSNDIDVLVSRRQLDLAERLLVGAAKGAGYILHNRAAFAPVSLFLHDPVTGRQLQVDLFATLEWRALELLPVDEVLSRRIPRLGFHVPDPVDEAVLNLITRLLYHGYIKENYRAGILKVFGQSPAAATQRLAPLFGETDAASLVDAVNAGRWSAIEQQTSKLRGALMRGRLRDAPARTARTARAAVRDAARLIRRWFKPPGLAVVLLGPDGCGKSTVAPKVIEALRHTFAPDKGLHIHWKPIVFCRRRREARRPTTNPHGRPPRSRPVSMLVLAYHWLEYLLGDVLQVRRTRFRNGLVLIDRHYYDFLVDPRRYRLNVPRWALRLVTDLLPNTDLVFLLDAPVDVLRSRKQEVPAMETERQREAFLALVNRLPTGRVIDATKTPDQVANQIVAAILQHLARRMNHG